MKWYEGSGLECMSGMQLDAISELYHENSKIHAGATAVHMSAEAMQIRSEGFKVYPGAKTIALCKESELSGTSVEAAIVNRRSRRTYSGTPISVAQLSTLLYLSCGEISPGRHRCAPSAGAL